MGQAPKHAGQAGARAQATQDVADVAPRGGYDVIQGVRRPPKKAGRRGDLQGGGSGGQSARRPRPGRDASRAHQAIRRRQQQAGQAGQEQAANCGPKDLGL